MSRLSTLSFSDFPEHEVLALSPVLKREDLPEAVVGGVFVAHGATEILS